MPLTIIYVRGGNKNAPFVAEKAGMMYGIRSESKAYGKVYMIDVHFHQWMTLNTDKERDYFWGAYMDKICALKPVLALAVDYMHPSQKNHAVPPN